PYRTRAVQQLIKGLAWGPPTSRAVWAALESPITATAAPTSTTSLPATPSESGAGCGDGGWSDLAMTGVGVLGAFRIGGAFWDPGILVLVDGVIAVHES